MVVPTYIFKVELLYFMYNRESGYCFNCRNKELIKIKADCESEVRVNGIK